MKTILSFLLASVALWASAQTYHPLVDESKLSSTKHFYCLDNEPTTDYVRFESDTVIGVYTYKHTWCYTNEAMNQRTLRGFIREDIAAKKVYFRYAAAGNEYLLYDFNAAVGDSVWLIDPYFVYVVDSIGTFTLLSGEERRSLKLHSTYYPACIETWIEGIGSITKGVLNSGTCGYTGDSPIMLCAWENDTMKYHNTGFPYCFIITSTEEFKERESYVRLFPNPATTGITIEIVRAAKSFLRFELLDPVGHILITQDLDSPNSFINLEKLKIAPGIYIYRITSPTAILKTDKLTIL